MRYDEFCDRLQDSLRQAGFSLSHAGGSSETIDLAVQARRWQAFVSGPMPLQRVPFHVSARIGFQWDSLESARSRTCEEDLLTALFGTRKQTSKTTPRWLRVDLGLHATLPHGSTTLVPDRFDLGPRSTALGEGFEPPSHERERSVSRVKRFFRTPDCYSL